MSIMYAQMGLAVSEALFNHQSEKLEYKLAKATQRYNKTMTALASAGQFNAVTENEISLRDSALRTAEAIQLESLQGRAEAESSGGGEPSVIALGNGKDTQAKRRRNVDSEGTTSSSSTMTLSASGSIIFPNEDTRLYFLAIYPSRKSVIDAAAKRTNAITE